MSTISICHLHGLPVPSLHQLKDQQLGDVICDSGLTNGMQAVLNTELSAGRA